MKSRFFLVALLIVSLSLVSASALQSGKQKGDPKVRSVDGAVEDTSGRPVEGAVVQLKNARTLQVRSFISQRDGTYYFHGLSTDVDYELKAEYQGSASSPRTLSVFDSRKNPRINLRLEPKK